MGRNDNDVAAILAEQNHDGLRRYALVDAAQDDRLPAALNMPSACLFGGAADTPIGRVSPHLVELSRNPGAPAWRWIARHAPLRPCLTVLAGTLTLAELLRHLQAFLEVKIGDKPMHLAYWDPAILATLVGQPDDDTGFEPGPIFTAEQRAAFLAPIKSWWYWDRQQTLRHIRTEGFAATVPADSVTTVLPLRFQPEQTRALVRASLPDRVLYELRLNQPDVLLGRDDWQNYDLTRRLLLVTDTLRIRGLRDQVNFVGTGMILGEDFHRRPEIASHLEAVRRGERSFTEALGRIPAETIDSVAPGQD